MITKQQILDQIKQMTQASGGTPPGRQKIASAIGLQKDDWIRFWPRWSDAIHEAGYTPNTLAKPSDRDQLLEAFSKLVLDLKRLPTDDDLKFRRFSDPGVPSHGTFRARLGPKAALIEQLTKYSANRAELEPVLKLCQQYKSPTRNESDRSHQSEDGTAGFVYLAKSGRYYKIGRSNSAGRRGYELALQLPERVKTIHVIKTDDPTGIEQYWHNRFASKRKNGEWFELDAADVAAFRRRRKYM